MSFLDLTPGSTHAVNNAVKLYLPPIEAARVLAICDRCQLLEASQPDPGEVERLRAEVQRLTPDNAHARQCRTNAIEALVLLALDNATLLADVMAVNHAFRVDKVLKHLNKHKDDRYKIKKAPSRAKIHAIMTQHGFML